VHFKRYFSDKIFFSTGWKFSVSFSTTHPYGMGGQSSHCPPVTAPLTKKQSCYCYIHDNPWSQVVQLSLEWADRTACIQRPESDFWSRKESNFPEWLQSHTRYGDAALSNAVQLTLWGYDAVIRRTSVTVARSNLAFKIATKPLQIETLLLLTAYKNSLLPYPRALLMFADFLLCIVYLQYCTIGIAEYEFVMTV